MSPLLSRRFAASVTAVLALVTASCSASDSPDDSTPQGPHIVASTAVYGDIAQQVAGEHAWVETIISDPQADPHSFEASPADAVAVTEADLVIFNGAGYDAFVDQALETTDGVPSIRAVDVFAQVHDSEIEEHSHEGHNHSDLSENEHVWYDLPTAAAVAAEIAQELSALDPDHADSYQSHADSFTDEIDALQDKVAAIAERGHFSYVQTEPIGAHLLSAAGLTDLTPLGFTTAIEDDSDPSAADLDATFDTLRGHGEHEHDVDLLAFNSQTRTSVTARVREVAIEQNVPVVELSESMPGGTNYQSWMQRMIDDLADALDSAQPDSGHGH